MGGGRGGGVGVKAGAIFRDLPRGIRCQSRGFVCNVIRMLAWVRAGMLVVVVEIRMGHRCLTLDPH